MINILIADDHRVLVQGLTELLNGVDHISVTQTASNGQEALDLLNDHPIDVVILDINMPVLDGLEACKRITAKYTNTKVLALTTLDKGSFIQQMLKNGASGYLLKNTSQEELILAIETVHNGETFINAQTNKILLDSIMKQKSNEAFIPTITRREREVLDLIAKEMTTQEMSEALFISTNTVETHRRNLIQKFNVRNSVGLLKEAMRKGMIE